MATTRELFDDPEHWEQRAEQARVRAAQIGDPNARETMSKVAANYERLAERAEARLAQVA